MSAAVACFQTPNKTLLITKAMRGLRSQSHSARVLYLFCKSWWHRFAARVLLVQVHQPLHHASTSCHVHRKAKAIADHGFAIGTHVWPWNLQTVTCSQYSCCGGAFCFQLLLQVPDMTSAGMAYKSLSVCTWRLKDGLHGSGLTVSHACQAVRLTELRM